MLAYNPQLALEAIWELVTRANKYVEESAPWVLSKVAKDGDEHAAAELEHVLFTLAEAVRIIGTLLEPFLPDTAQRISHAARFAGRIQCCLERSASVGTHPIRYAGSRRRSRCSPGSKSRCRAEGPSVRSRLCIGREQAFSRSSGGTG